MAGIMMPEVIVSLKTPVSGRFQSLINLYSLRSLYHQKKRKKKPITLNIGQRTWQVGESGISRSRRHKSRDCTRSEATETQMTSLLHSANSFPLWKKFLSSKKTKSPPSL